jgi:hypothetical protein
MSDNLKKALESLENNLRVCAESGDIDRANQIASTIAMLRSSYNLC